MKSTHDVMPEALFLVGATASGKTAVAQRIAELRGYSILSADSMLIYRGMDIGTAKPSFDERARVRYYGLDLVNPDETYSVWQYREYAVSVLAFAREPGLDETFLVVGGSGLYIKSLTSGMADMAGANPETRRQLEKVFDEGGVEALQKMLIDRNPSLYAGLKDKMNPRRLIRALELATAGDDKRSATWAGRSGRRPNRPVIVGLIMPQAELAERIRKRVEAMYRNGLADEVISIVSGGRKMSRTGLQAIGYAEAMDFIGGKCSESEAIERTVIRTRRLAKKQMTWFRNQENVDWVDVREGMSMEDIASMVEEKWRVHGFTKIK